MKVFIVILNWNRAQDTIESLASVSKLRVERFELTTLIVDNGSEDDSVEKIKKYIGKKHGFKILRNSKNRGFTGGINTGLKYAITNAADYIMVLNNDTILDKNLVEELVSAAEFNRAASAFSPKIYFESGFEFHKDRYNKNDLGKVIWYAGGKIDWNNVYGTSRGVNEVDHGQYSNVSEIDYATGACVLYRAETLRKVGLFDEKYFLYFEDTDLSMRIKKADKKIIFVPKAKLWHKVSQSSGIGSDLNDYFITRNRMLFGMKYAPLRAKLALIRESVKFLVSGRKWQRIGILDFYRCNFGKGSWK